MKKKHLINDAAAITKVIAALGALIIPGCKQPLLLTTEYSAEMGDNFTYVAHRAYSRSILAKVTAPRIFFFCLERVQSTPQILQKHILAKVWSITGTQGFENFGSVS